MYPTLTDVYSPTQKDPNAGLLSKLSPLQNDRANWKPELPYILRSPVDVDEDTSVTFISNKEDEHILKDLFPLTSHQKYVKLKPHSNSSRWSTHPPIRIGVVLSGGQAPGGHNVIAGIFDFAKQCNPNSQVVGFLGGPAGVYNGKYITIDAELMKKYRNQGGFHMIRSGRHKIETEQQKLASMEICQKLALHGLVIVGGDDSNTNAAVLAEYFEAQKCTTRVIGCPKTIDGDLKNKYVEISFGFDTATKVYSELIGNLMTDVATSRNRYHFCRLMGRSASNITLECALQTRPNLCFIGEEIQENNISLSLIVDETVEMIIKRHQLGKDYGVVLIPEGLIEFIPEVGKLIRELNEILSKDGSFDETSLSEENKTIFNQIPKAIRKTLLLERDPHGNVQVAKIATEQLLILMVQQALEERGLKDIFKASAHYFGYEGRCAMPSNFDAIYCYALGHTAGALVDCGVTACMACVTNLYKPFAEWQCAGCPLQKMMTIERRKGKYVPVIKKYLVDKSQPLFKLFAEVRDEWKYHDFYMNPGPIQFSGPTSNNVNYLIKAPTKAELLPPLPFNLELLKKRYNFIKSETYLSPLQKERLRAKIEVTPLLTVPNARFITGPKSPLYDPQGNKFIRRAFPKQCNLHNMVICNVIENNSLKQLNYRTCEVEFSSKSDLEKLQTEKTLRIGVVLQGQQAPGSSNVLHGLYERIRISSTKGVLLGFKGTYGLLEREYIEITKEDLKLYLNQGGFELLGRTKHSKPLIRTESGLKKVLQTCSDLSLDGLVMIGGQTSLTDAALITEYLLENNCETRVVGIPATHDNNLRHSLIEACIGFDSTSKCYSSLVGNLLIDAASATKYWYFVRIMGQIPSHMVLEVALQTHPNMCIISEKYAESDRSIFDVVQDIADIVCSRSKDGQDFGTVLIPEGLVSQLPYLRQLFSQLNVLLSNVLESEYSQLKQELIECEKIVETADYLKRLDPVVLATWTSLPGFFREQLVQKSGIDFSEVSIEQLLSQMVTVELERRKSRGEYNGTFSPICHYLGFQGRSTMPSEFDCRLGLVYGYLSCLAVESKLTGYVMSVRGLCGHFSTWKLSAIPITALMKVMPERETKAYGRDIPMVPCAEVDLAGKAYIAFKNVEEQWEKSDSFCNPGPIQFSSLTAHYYNRTLHEEHAEYFEMLRMLEYFTNYIETFCTFGVDETALRTAVLSLDSLTKILEWMRSSEK